MGRGPYLLMVAMAGDIYVLRSKDVDGNGYR